MDKVTALRKYCPNCKKGRHASESVFCLLCGTKLQNESKRELYLRLNIPSVLIDIEEARETVFSGFPFFLRQTDPNLIQVITLHDFPLCNHLVKNRHTPIGPNSHDVVLNEEIIKEFLNQGYVWHHESEMDVLW